MERRSDAATGKDGAASPFVAPPVECRCALTYNPAHPTPQSAAGADARVGCEPGQVRKEAALSGTGLVPSVSRSRFAAGFFSTCLRAKRPASGTAKRGILCPVILIPPSVI